MSFLYNFFPQAAFDTIFLHQFIPILSILFPLCSPKLRSKRVCFSRLMWRGFCCLQLVRLMIGISNWDCSDVAFGCDLHWGIFLVWRFYFQLLFIYLMTSWIQVVLYLKLLVQHTWKSEAVLSIQVNKFIKYLIFSVLCSFVNKLF